MSAIVKADDYVGGLPEVFQLAKSLKLAGGFLPAHLKNEGEIVAVVLAGRELGLPPMASIRGIKLVKGNVTLDASLQLALMVRAGCRVQWLKDGSDGEAVLRLERPGQEPHESRFTLAMARAAGLSGDNWTKYPGPMLRARCVTTAGKAYVPDVLAGVYLPDELPDDSQPAQVRSVRTLDSVAAEGERERPLAATEQRRTSQTTGSTTTTTESPEGGLGVSNTPKSAGGGADTHAGTPRPTNDAIAATRTTTAASSESADGELLDAKAWRSRLEALAEEMMQAGILFEQEDEYGMPVPPFDEPVFSAKSKNYAGKPYSAAPVGLLRKMAQDERFALQSPGERIWTLALIARHELAKEQAP